MKILLEIAVDSIAGAEIAVSAGADRIELCSALSEGGLTPSLGNMRAAASLGIPVFAMIRPRGGDFFYSQAETRIMRDDITAAIDAGMTGFVFGALRRDLTLDSDLLADLMALTGNLPVTLHRAFDLVSDQSVALEQASALGFRRILTSGQAVSAELGQARLAELAAQANGKIAVLPGAGIRAHNVVTILSVTGVEEIHAACRLRASTDARMTSFGLSDPGGPSQTDGTAVRNLRRAIDLATVETQKVTA